MLRLVAQAKLARDPSSSSIASSSIADSVANRPGTAPGPRIAVGAPTFRRVSADVTRRFGTLYKIRRRLAAVLLVVVQHDGVVDVFVLERGQLPVAPRARSVRAAASAGDDRPSETSLVA